jgi:hypothetical protein
MTANNGFPSQTTAGQGLFNGPSSVGMIQGQADPDPATRFALRSGIVSNNETVPMWGGIGVYALVPPISTTGPVQSLGQSLGRATGLTGSTGLVGFSVFDQGYNLVNDPISTVPTAGSGQSLNWYALGSRARIAVACSADLVSLRGGAINQQVGWDFINQELVPYSPGYSQATITDAVWSATNGGQTDFTVSTNLTADIFPGDFITVAGVVNTGGTSTSAFNGNWMVVTITSTDVTVAMPAAASPGTYASGGDIAAGGSNLLPVTVLDIQPTGCMVVQSLAGAYTYNYSGACAKIQLTGGTTA